MAPSGTNRSSFRVRRYFARSGTSRNFVAFAAGLRTRCDWAVRIPQKCPFSLAGAGKGVYLHRGNTKPDDGTERFPTGRGENIKKMTRGKGWLLSLCLLAGLGTAGCAGEEEKQASNRAREFAEDYFNLRFDEAYESCTADSRKWIAFRASNITERDLEAVRAAAEEAYVSSAEFRQIDDSTAFVRCVVCQALAADSLEQRKGRIVPEAAYLVPLRKEGRRWLVRMEGPLRSAK